MCQRLIGVPGGEASPRRDQRVRRIEQLAAQVLHQPIRGTGLVTVEVRPHQQRTQLLVLGRGGKGRGQRGDGRVIHLVSPAGEAGRSSHAAGRRLAQPLEPGEHGMVGRQLHLARPRRERYLEALLRLVDEHHHLALPVAEVEPHR